MPTETFAEQAYDHILNRLFRQDLRPGDVLDRKQIARDLEVSLIPVADAVQRLTHEGFLTTRRRQGTFVSSPNRDDVRGQLLLREALECQSARLVCGEKVTSARPRLRRLAREADKAADAGQPLWSEDFAFHQALVALTDCAALIRCFQGVAKLSMFHQTALISPLSPGAYDRHARLLDDLCKATPDAAEARIRRHMRMGKEALY